MFADALRAHCTALQAVAGESVTYRRGNSHVTITAVPGQSVFDESTGATDVVMQTKTVDWLISPDDLKIDGNQSEPQRGDQIIRADGEKLDLLPGSGNKSWAWSDSRKTHYRIHTVRRVAS